MPIDDAVHFAQLMHTGKYSDLMLVCAGQEFRVHKMIVCSQSSVIAAAVDGSFEVLPSLGTIFHALITMVGVANGRHRYTGI